jgi:hypothetical protein
MATKAQKLETSGIRSFEVIDIDGWMDLSPALVLPSQRSIRQMSKCDNITVYSQTFGKILACL